MSLDFESNTFETETINLSGTQERIVRGGRNLFDLLPKALEILSFFSERCLENLDLD